MNRFAHGGGAPHLAAELDRPVAEILDFSASINPLGMPRDVHAAARDAIDAAIHYPEIDAASLISALARHHELAACHFLAGSGSTPLFYHFARLLRPVRALLVRPAFSEYERSLLQAGTTLDYFDLDAANAFHLDPAALLRRVTPQTDLIFLANPGNPAGTVIPPETILTIAHAVREQALVAVDEAFIDFCPEHSVLRQVTAYGNLYVFRSLTKFYAIPGLRAGYLAGTCAGIARLTAAAEPWALSTPAIAAAMASLAAADYRRQTLDTIPRLRHELHAGLEQLGLTVFPSAANFLLARLPGGDSETLAARLRREGILIRPCANFPPLDNRYLRVAVRSAADNRLLLTALKTALAALRQDETRES